MIMKLTSILFSGLLLAVSASAASAQNYYVCDNGDDNNNGRTETAPFRSYEKAMDTFNKMAAGDSILFCRGGVFPATKLKKLANSNCSSEKNCTITDYGDDAKPAPMIVSDGITVFNFQNPGNSSADGGYHIKNMTLISKQKAPAGIMLFNDVNDVLMENLHIEGFTVAVYSAGANTPNSGSNQANDRIILKNSKLLNNKMQGWLGGCNDCVIDNNHFEGNGFGMALRGHNVYIDSPVKSQNFYNNNIRFTNNTLLNSGRVDGRCQGTSFVVHGIIKNLTIDSNVVREEVGKTGDNCWGISVDPGNQLDESFVGLRITNNKIFNVGNLGIGCASCKDVLIADNLIVDEGEVLRYVIAVPNKHEDSQKSENVTIRNNKIVANHDLAYGISLGGENRFEAINNEISLSSTDSRSKCINVSNANLDTDISNNICNSHTSVSIIDDSAPIDEVPVAENTEPELSVDPTEPVTEQTENDSQPVYQRGSGLVASDNTTENGGDSSLNITSADRGIVQDAMTEETAISGNEGTSTSISGSSSTETGDAPLDDGLSDSTTRSTMLSASVQDSASMIDQSISPELSEPSVSEPVTRTRVTESISSNYVRSVTVDEVANVIENDIPVEESQCRVFARGRCMMM